MSNDQNNDPTEQKTLSQAIRNRMIESIESHGDREKKDKRKSVLAVILSKIPLRFKIIGLGVIIIAVFLLYKFGLPVLLNHDETQYITSESLTKAVKVEEIATIKGSYTGIADHHKANDPEKKINYRIKYKVDYSAHFNLDEIKFEIDENEDTVYAVLPDPVISTNVPEAQELEYLPKNPKDNIKEILTVCNEDAKNEIESDFIKNEAIESLKGTVRCLTEPLLKGKYNLDFK